jgi:MFS family permease
LSVQTKMGELTKEKIASNIKRNTFLLVGNSVVFSCILQIILVISPIIILDSTNSLALAGLATALILSADMPTNYHAGKLADNIGRKKTLLIGTVIGLIGLLLMAVSRLLIADLLFWAGLVIFGLSTGFFVLNRAAIMDMYPKKRGQSLGYLNTGSFVGSFLGPIFVTGIDGLAFLAGINSYDLLILTCLVLLIFAGFLIVLIRLDTKNIAEFLYCSDSQFDTEIKNSGKESWTSGPHGRRDLFLAFIISSLSVGGVSIVFTLCPILLHILEIEIEWISFSVALVSVGTGGLSMFSGNLADRFGRKKTVFLGATIMGVALFVLPLAQNYIVISLASFIIGLGAGAIAIASTALMCDMIVPKNRGKVFGANSFVINIVTFTLPPLVATLITSPGPISISLLGIIIAIIVILSMNSISRKSTMSYRTQSQ